MAGPTVSVVIPTQRRAEPLTLAAGSVLRQQGVDFTRVELVIADNDQAPSARAVAERLAAQAPCPVRYVHEPRPGVANVRNAALAQARGELIAFLDDDEEAPPHWLAELLSAMQAHGSDVVFGPVRGRAPAGVIQHRPYLEQFFSRVGPAETGAITGFYGCGNSLVRRAALPDPQRPFDSARNQTGGEDDLLFGGMKDRGARFAWAAQAWVWEDPSPDRLRLGYTLRRAFAYGQGPTVMSAAGGRPFKVLYWMAVGLAQLVVYGVLAAGKCALRAPDRAYALDRAARGLGKILWFPPFKFRFYGHASGQVRPTSADGDLAVAKV
ncbi:MAG TPA: glycosyltransferase family 2 protein [Caulobacteraceae bacterium]|nr:glycosyltransferase family 2 protein [Caulobacteraceae bacterium]